MSKLTSFRSILAFTFLVALMASMNAISFAQSAVTGAISGTVSDPRSAVLPNARVSIRNLGTNKEETAITGNEGSFKFNNLQPGTYAATITASGFADYKLEQVIVEVGRSTNIDASLKIAGSGETVQIVADAGLVNTESKEFTSNINQTA